MKQTTPATPKTREAKSTGVEPLVDDESQIVDHACPYLLVDLCCELFPNHVKKEDHFRVVNSGLYF